VAPKEGAKNFVENVTGSYILQSRIYLRSNMTEDGLVDADAIAVLLNIPRDTVLDLARRQLIPS
jgi:hypothetical protein